MPARRWYIFGSIGWGTSSDWSPNWLPGLGPGRLVSLRREWVMLTSLPGSSPGGPHRRIDRARGTDPPRQAPSDPWSPVANRPPPPFMNCVSAANSASDSRSEGYPAPRE